MARIQSKTCGKKATPVPVNSREFRESFKSSKIYNELPSRRFGELKPVPAPKPQ